MFCRFFLYNTQILFSLLINSFLAFFLHNLKEMWLYQSFRWINVFPMFSHMLAQRIFDEILRYFNTWFKNIKLNSSPHFDAPKVISPKTKRDNIPNIDVNIVAKEAVHHDSIIILDIFVSLPILIQDIISKKVHMKGNKAHAQLIKHFKSILIFVTEWVINSNINENDEVHPV